MAHRVVAGSLILAASCAVAWAFPFPGIPDRAATFKCSPDTLRPGDTLTISISSPHGTDLGIRTPDNSFFFVYSCDERVRSSQLKGIDCEDFAKLGRITIDVSSLRAAVLAHPGETAHVFVTPGAYNVLLAKNLETENTAATVNRCRVQLASK